MPLTGVLDSQELRHSIRDLVALSTLPAIWKAYDPQQIADSVAAALLTMLDSEIVCVSLPSEREEFGHRDHQDRRHLGRVGQRHPHSLAGMAAERVVEPSGKCSPAWAKHPLSRLLSHRLWQRCDPCGWLPPLRLSQRSPTASAGRRRQRGDDRSPTVACGNRSAALCCLGGEFVRFHRRCRTGRRAAVHQCRRPALSWPWRACRRCPPARARLLDAERGGAGAGRAMAPRHARWPLGRRTRLPPLQDRWRNSLPC